MQPISQTFVPISPPVCGIGPLGLCSGDSENETIRLTAALISTAIGLLTVIAALFFMFVLITGAIQMISAGGDKGQIEEARKKFTNGAIGLVITISAIFLIDVIANLLNIPSILDVRKIINLIRISPSP